MRTLYYFCNFSVVVTLFQNKTFYKIKQRYQKLQKNRVHNTNVLLPTYPRAWPPWNLPKITVYLISLSNELNLVVYKQKTVLFFSNYSVPTCSVKSPFITSE